MDFAKTTFDFSSSELRCRCRSSRRFQSIPIKFVAGHTVTHSVHMDKRDNDEGDDGDDTASTSDTTSAVAASVAVAVAANQFLSNIGVRPSS